MRKLILTLCLMMFSAGILAAGDWHGTWQTNWRQGGAELELVQEGNQVRGHYEPFNGTIEAIVNDDGSLTGTWKQPGSEGEFMFTLAEDKKTFSGRFDSGEWWNGVKVSNKAQLGKSLYVHLESPRATLKSFLNAGNWIAYGDNNYIDDLIETVILPAQGEVLYRQKFEVAQLYFRLIAMDTIRLFNLPEEVEGDKFSFELFRRQNDFSHSINFVKNDKGWHLVLPKRAQIRTLINEAEEAGIYRQKAPNGHFELNTPRETIRTFLEEFSRFNQGTETIVLNTLNVSMLDESVRQWEAPVVAQYLKEVLDRISYVVWQEIPNDPDSTVPYRHFTHPKGIIEVAPATRDGKTVWLFTPKTIDNIRTLHDGVENLPLPEGIPPFENTAFFFNVRDYVKQLPGPLTNRYFNLELWQWIGALLLLLFSFTLSNLVRIRLNRFVKILPGFRSRTLSNINAIVGIPAMLITIGLIWVYALFIFGIPDYLFSFLRTLSQLLITLGSIWLGYVAVTEISKYLLSKALQTESIIDEIIVTLISSLIKGGVIIFGVMLIAEILGIPFGTVVAGLGIGGIAFAIAAKDTVANFFGSAVILADRPFKPGDTIVIGDFKGNIESVGLRSTRIRAENDALVFIPNSIVSRDIISNEQRKRRTLVDTRIPIDPVTNSEKLETCSARIISYFEKDDMVFGKFLAIGVNDFSPGTIMFRLRFYINAVDKKVYLMNRHRLLNIALAVLEEEGVELAKHMVDPGVMEQFKPPPVMR